MNQKSTSKSLNPKPIIFPPWLLQSPVTVWPVASTEGIGFVWVLEYNTLGFRVWGLGF